MDAWQQTVETRLVSLDGRIAKVEDRLGAVETSLATLTERVSHLPTKGWMAASAVGIVGAVTTAIGYAEKIQTFLN